MSHGESCDQKNHIKSIILNARMFYEFLHRASQVHLHLKFRTFLPAAKPTGLVETNFLSFFLMIFPNIPTKTSQPNMTAYLVGDIQGVP